MNAARTTPPASPEAMHLLAVDRSTPSLMEYQTAYHALRWVNTVNAAVPR